MRNLVELSPDSTVVTFIRASVVPDEVPEPFIELTDAQALGLKVGMALKRNETESGS
jgi:hypothetical protein